MYMYICDYVIHCGSGIMDYNDMIDKAHIFKYLIFKNKI